MITNILILILPYYRSRECQDLPASTLQSISERMKAEFPDKWALMEQRKLAPTRKDLSIAT